MVQWHRSLCRYAHYTQFIASTPNSAFGDSEWKSPFDTCPATISPLSLINLQVSVGGQNVLQPTLQYNYEHF